MWIYIWMYLFQLVKEDLDEGKRWFELGNAVGLEIVGDEEVEEELERYEEDSEMARIMASNKENKRKLLHCMV